MPDSSVFLEADVWRASAREHAARADALTADHRARARHGEKHPVWDFLFTYYSYKPSQLRRWHPGAGVTLLDGAAERSTWRWYSPGAVEGSVTPDAARFANEKPQLATLVRRMLGLTAARPGRFDCFGLHEWAMVYHDDEHRHAVPLRLGQSGTDAVVDSHELRCTHIDAFRFFTTDAAPRNTLTPTRKNQPLMEQPGCLHAGMDVYKWIVKLGPLVPGNLLLDAFELARDIRMLDMQASPYDLTEWGVQPVRIETTDGKAEYVRQQRVFMRRSNELRRATLRAWLGEDISHVAPSDHGAGAHDAHTLHPETVSAFT